MYVIEFQYLGSVKYNIYAERNIQIQYTYLVFFEEKL